MNKFDENDYLKMKKNEIKIFRSKDHGKEVDKIMKKEFPKIRNFPYNSYEEIQKYQLKRISEIVDYAYENIPLYHKKYSSIGYKKGMIKTWEDFRKLPILYKDELIEGFPNEIVKNVEDFNLSTRSSGSSGKFVTLALSLQAIYIDTIQGIRQFVLQSGNNYNPEDVILFIYTLPWWIRNINGKYKQDFLPTTSSVEDVIKKLMEIRPKFISTYPTYLEKMASYGVNLKEYGVELVIVHSEQSTRQYRDSLEKELNVKILDEYSSEELTRIALECPNHTYHLEEDACYIEIVDPKTKKNKKYGERGIVVGTNLLNTATPIIRYYQGDLAEIDKPVKCKCGNNCRVLKNINGRYMDSIITEDGDIIPASAFMDIAYNWFSSLAIPIHGLRYQFIQRTKNTLELYLIKGKYEIDIQKIIDSVYMLIPKKMNLEIKVVEELPEVGQKYRPVISFVKEGK